MPKTKFQNVVFTAIMAFCMVYGMIVYNISLSRGGVSPTSFLAAFHEIPIMMPIAFVLEITIVGKLAARIVFSVLRPTDRPQFVTYAMSLVICAIMCPIMSLIATILFKDSKTFSTFIQTWAMNFPDGAPVSDVLLRPLCAASLPHPLPCEKDRRGTDQDPFPDLCLIFPIRKEKCPAQAPTFPRKPVQGIFACLPSRFPSGHRPSSFRNCPGIVYWRRQPAGCRAGKRMRHEREAQCSTGTDGTDGHRRVHGNRAEGARSRP